jgi:hypothetical protein
MARTVKAVKPPLKRPRSMKKTPAAKPNSKPGSRN